uniref:ABC transporter domain-containing protein n=1 Tax=uncultured alpha proteobacterium HF0070_34E11 TaxID=710807 RepID=E0XXI3_9PROT|nr:hypothetical protein [uncultured alpha proteobacterium HF0070_34E11]
MEKEELLSVSNLNVKFELKNLDVNAVKGTSFSINKGETLAIVGESGSGKSVTAMSIMRLNDFTKSAKTSGSIKLRQKDGSIIDLSVQTQTEMREKRGNELAMIFQEPMSALNPILNIETQLTEAILMHHDVTKTEAKKRAVDLLNKVRIPEAKNQIKRYPHQLSGGMRQRVMIAMALASNPSLLIADEPTTALDVTIQAQILNLLKALQSETGMSVLFITHDMGVVAEIADRVIVMYKGNIVERGHCRDIFHSPQHSYTKKLISSVPRLGSMEGESVPKKFELRENLTNTNKKKSISQTINFDRKRSSKEPLLRVKNLEKLFYIKNYFTKTEGNVHAVDNIDLDIYEGETVSLVGESGCGKSTTGRTLIQLEQKTRGSIFFEGRDLAETSKKELFEIKKSMQMVFQDPFSSLNPRIRIGDAIAEPIYVHKFVPKSEVLGRVEYLLNVVELGGSFIDRYPHELSGGQRQRVCIARALSCNPRLIIADEAVSALDVSIQAQVVNLLIDLQSEFNFSYLFISHDMSVVERISHRVAVMYLGKIVEIGKRSEIFGNPQHDYTKKLLAAVPIADPDKRKSTIILNSDEIPSPMMPIGYVSHKGKMEKVSDTHFFQVN